MKRYTFESGLKFIHDFKLTTKQAAFRVYVNIGSILETPKQKGIAHLVEHLIFKSTKKRTTLEIAKQLEMYGAEINAYTNYDVTCFHFTCLPENFDKCIEIYSDMLFNKNISQEEFEKEKQVVIQELCMYQDLYDATNEENFYKEYYKWDPIIGYREILDQITLEDVMDFIHKYYIPKNMTVSTVSNMPFFVVKKSIKKYFAQQNNDGIDTNTMWTQVTCKPIRFDNKAKKIKKDISQAQVFIAYEIAKKDQLCNVYTTFIKNICDYGLSSVFFEEVREKNGLCYGIHAEVERYKNNFIDFKYPFTFNIAVKTEVKNVKKLINTVDSVMNHLPELIDETDIIKLKNLYKQHEVTSAERAAYNAKHFDDHKFMSIDKEIRICKKMTLKKVKQAIIKYFTTKPKYKAMLLGNF